MAKKKRTKKKAAKKPTSTSRAVKKKSSGSKSTRVAAVKNATAKATKKAAPKKAKKKSSKRPRKVVEYAMAKRAINRYGDEIRSLPGVTDVSVGLRFKGGKPTNTITLRLHVKTEKEKQYLKANADELGLQREYGGIGSDIIVRGDAKLASQLEDGSRIKTPAICTIGTVARANVDGDFSNNPNVYLTAAHGISKSPIPTGAVVKVKDAMTLNVIGTVRSDHYFLDEEIDLAYILPPDGQRLTRPIGRTTLPLNSTDVGKTVTIKITRSNSIVERSGTIDSVDYPGTLDGTQRFDDHVSVVYSGELKKGDSGAAVWIRDELAGFLRGLFVNEQIAVVSKAFLARTKTNDASRGFRIW